MKTFSVIRGIFFAALLAGCATTARQGAMVRARDAFQAGRFEEAIGHAQRAQRYEGADARARAEAMLLQARCHEALKDRAAAVALYAAVARDFPGTPSAAQAGARLRELNP